MRCREVPPEETLRLGLARDALALSVRETTDPVVKRRNPSAAKIGLRRGDVIVEVDGQKASLGESQFLVYLMQKKTPGQKVDLTYLRDGKRQAVQLQLPEGLSTP
jgi:S1-C subfamily serine protease